MFLSGHREQSVPQRRENTMRREPTPYRIETARTVIRCWELRDARLLRDALDVSDRHLRPWIPWMRDQPKSLVETVAWIRSTRAAFDLDREFRYAVFDRSETVLIGETGLYTRAGEGAREIGYWISAPHAGRGYATEVAAAMVKVGFEVVGVGRVEIHIARGNEVSLAIPPKLGFTLDATVRRRMIDSEGEVHDRTEWTLFADEYPESPAAGARVTAFDGIGEVLLAPSDHSTPDACAATMGYSEPFHNVGEPS
jgi:RimJ/RimL family protein N-acetyltransferase